ncbi:MAG: ACP S-malonyltransferase [Sciscionella sp.]
MIALLAPGQGAQTSGMLEPWLDAAGARDRVAQFSEAAGLDLLRLGTTADAEEIKDTAVTQPLIVATSLLAFEQLRQRVDLPADVPVAGHSIGELAAATIAGVLSAEEAVALAAVRGAEMAAACALEPTGMSAMMGGDPDEVLARLDELGLEPANRNGAGQMVAAGPLSALRTLADKPPAKVKVVSLKVAGAFHTRFMAPATEKLRARAERITPNDPARPLLSNADGAVMESGAETLRRLVQQVTLPVRWDKVMATLGGLGASSTVELPPGKTLSGLVKRELRPAVTLALKSPAELDLVAELLAEHTTIGSQQ